MAETTTTTTTASGTMTQTPTQTQTQSQQTTTGTASTWVDSLSADMKTFVTEQGFKEPSDVVAGYQGMLKLRGVAADKLLRTPDSYTDAKEQEAAWNSIYDRLGRPKTSADYGIESKEDSENTKFMADTFHKAGLSKTQAETIAKAFNERQSGLQKTSLENQQLMAKQSVDKLKTEWGSTFDNNMRVARQGQNALGWDDKKVDQIASTIGVGETIKMLNDVGRRVGEGQFIQGNKGEVTHTPDTAQAKIKQLMSDRGFIERLSSGDAQAKAQWQALHEQWGGGQHYA